ncbi:unnamed protein product [Caenorhabditis angaria]|uniref:Uncharacterized protein n=1 Tax=Caenorhabditis angaria TaxID=860376 RepID=A0A9P1IQ80_9PELO|nr:unnamed protein product [Caenorhabditis angaria]
MYRSEISAKILENPNLVDKIVVIILPNYFYEYEGFLQHLLRENFGIIEKSVKNFKRNDIMEWRSSDLESQDIWGLAEKITSGPCMVLLCERANAFLEMRELSKYHNDISKKMSSSTGIYFSRSTIAAYQDIAFFYPKHINEKEMIKHAQNYLSVEVWPKLSEALARVAVEKPENPIKWLAEYLKTR